MRQGRFDRMRYLKAPGQEIWLGTGLEPAGLCSPFLYPFSTSDVGLLNLDPKACLHAIRLIYLDRNLET